MSMNTHGERPIKNLIPPAELLLDKIKASEAELARLQALLVEAQFAGAGRLYDWLKLNGYVIALPQHSHYRHGAMDLQAAILPRSWAIEAAIGKTGGTQEPSAEAGAE